MTCLPREGDSWLMKAFEDAGYSGQELLWLNTVCNHQQVVFESDIFGADGSHFDDQYLKYRTLQDNLSCWTFTKQPPHKKSSDYGNKL